MGDAIEDLGKHRLSGRGGYHALMLEESPTAIDTVPTPDAVERGLQALRTLGR